MNSVLWDRGQGSMPEEYGRGSQADFYTGHFMRGVFLIVPALGAGFDLLLARGHYGLNESPPDSAWALVGSYDAVQPAMDQAGHIANPPWPNFSG